MESPRAPQGLASEAVTPGASVAAQHGDRHTSAFDTPGPPSPGQASPSRHRSQEERSASRGRASAGLEAAAAALAAGDNSSPAAASPAPPEPLSRPRLRVQGADIILEDASSPKAEVAAAAAAAPSAPANHTQQPPAAPTAAAGSQPAAAAAAANHATLQALAAAAHAPQHAASQHLLSASTRTAQSHEHELQLRLASRTATGLSNVAVISSKPPQHVVVGPGTADERGQGHEGAAAAELAPAGSSAAAAAVEGPVRMKYRSTLTEENVAYLNKLDQYSSRPDSSERIWRWLEGSGPPFDNPPPSLGVPTVTKGSSAAAGKRQAGKRGFCSCLGCFGGGQQ